MKRITLLLVIVQSFLSLGLELDQMPIPPSHEKTRSFTFLFVERQPEIPVFLKNKIKQLELKSRVSWTPDDSLTHAFQLVYLKDYTHALNYFSRVQTDTIKNQVTLQLLEHTYLKTNRFTSLKGSISKGVQSSNVKEIRLRLVEVREMKMNRTWDHKQNTIFPILKDSINYIYRKNQKQYYKYLVPRAEDFKTALLYDVIYSDESDPILSQAFEEYGDFLHEHFYLTNAFMAYSISRHYNKRNSSTATKLKNTKREMDEANLLPPSFRENFAKIGDQRYTFREIATTTTDSLGNVSNNSLSLEDIARLEAEKKPDFLPWINSEMLLVIVLSVILMFVLIFVKTRK
jgi:hypothetical protein